MNEKYSCLHFSLSLPASTGQDDVPALLKHLAKTIEGMPEKINIQDIIFSDDGLDENDNQWPHFTVYYYLGDKK